MPNSGPYAFKSLFDRLTAYKNVIYALVMHDIKNRFFGSGLGQIVMVLWPVAHILVIIGVYIATNRPNPYGESITQYGAVSLFPFIIFNYVSRWIVFSAITNKGFLQYAVIKPLDILVARAILEFVSISIVGILLVILVSIVGNEVMPVDKAGAVSAVLATVFFSVGFGFLNAPLAFLIPIWNVVITIVIILSYIASGIVFLPTSLPAPYQYYLSFNPLLNCVEWLRACYFTGYPTSLADSSYVVECGLTCLTLGLILNALLRRFY